MGAGVTSAAAGFRGSGGGGGGGGGGGDSYQVNSGGGGGGGGAAGGAGGAAIALHAIEAIVLNGKILSRGTTAGNGVSGGNAGAYSAVSEGPAGDGGSGGNAGNASSGTGGKAGAGAKDAAGARAGFSSGPGGTGGNGGAGAGGGVLLHAPSLSGSGSVDVRGGRDQTANGGVVKLFNCPGSLALNLGTLLAGAIQTGQTDGPAPTFVQQPSRVDAQVGTQACFSASATGATSYQWRKNQQNIPNATGPQYCIPSVSLGDAGNYDVVAANGCGLQYSAVATLKVLGNLTISGVVWDDLNRNAVRDSQLISGDQPTVVFIIDISDSTKNHFGGSVVGDKNDDGRVNTTLDAEIAGFEALNQNLVDRGFGSSARISIIKFNGSYSALTLRPSQPAGSLSSVVTTPTADENSNGVRDVTDALRTLRFGGLTRFAAPLQAAMDLLDQLGVVPRDGNIIFLTDGFPDPSEPQTDSIVSAIRGRGYNLRAFGAVVANTPATDLATEQRELARLDPNYIQFHSTDELLQAFSGTGIPGTQLLEPALGNITVFVDLNANGSFDVGEPSVVTGSEASPGTNYHLVLPNPAAGSYQLRVAVPIGRVQTFPVSNAALPIVYNGKISELTGQNFGLVQNLNQRVVTARKSGGGIQISWTGQATLQSATTLAGPWVPVTGAISGAVFPADKSLRLFRVVGP